MRALIPPTLLSLQYLCVESLQILILLEDFVELVPINGTTREDILKALMQCIKVMGLNLSKLVSVTTDGAPAMIGKCKGVVALLQKHLEHPRRSYKITKSHCLVHQEALCTRTTNFKSVVDAVVKAVNVILSCGMNHVSFASFY